MKVWSVQSMALSNAVLLLVVAGLATVPGFSPPPSPLTRRATQYGETRCVSPVAVAVTPTPSRYGASPFRTRKPRFGSLGAWWARQRVKRDPGSIPAPGEVGTLSSVKQLRAVLATHGNAKFVALVFGSKPCKACDTIKAPFAAKAAACAEQGLFFEIRCEQKPSQPLCKACKIRFAPTGHIYVCGELIAAMAAGKSDWDAFAERLDEVNASPSAKHLA